MSDNAPYFKILNTWDTFCRNDRQILVHGFVAICQPRFQFALLLFCGLQFRNQKIFNPLKKTNTMGYLVIKKQNLYFLRFAFRLQHLMISPYSSHLILSSCTGNMGYDFLACLKKLPLRLPSPFIIRSWCLVFTAAGWSRSSSISLSSLESTSTLKKPLKIFYSI